MINASATFYTLLAGFLPALIWLAFWQREDKKRPEPRGLIIRTFLSGALAVILVLPFQKMVASQFPTLGFITFLLWALIEESFKFGAAYLGGLASIEDNEPIDPLIYMITAALGFVALENALFVVNPLIQADIAASVVTGGLRFIGSSLLHTISSATIGIALAFAFYKRKRVKWLSGIIGLLLAVVFHTIFNLFIFNQSSMSPFYTFSGVWAGIIILLLFFEKIKTIAP